MSINSSNGAEISRLSAQKNSPVSDDAMNLLSTKHSFRPYTFLAPNGKDSVMIYPERGGIVTSLQLKGQEIFYPGMLQETLGDISKSVKGGIPILFPNAGPLTHEEQETSGLDLPQHGFARNNLWHVTSDNDSSSFIQRLSSKNIADKHGYVWDGEISNTITFRDNGSCRFDYVVTNTGTEPLPISLGLHPYFDVPKGNKNEILWEFEGGNQIMKDIDSWSNGGTTRIDIPKDGIVKFFIPGVGRIQMKVSVNFERLWVWSLPGKNFVCVEPIMREEGALVKDPRFVMPYDAHLSFIELSVTV